MPETNRYKIDFYGDKDAIGEKTAELFKREKYHPLLSLVPLAIQIVILMCFVKVIYGIGDRLVVAEAAAQGLDASNPEALSTLVKPLIACVPWTDGGWSWLMPLIAGAAAWLLGYTQNIFNPLQHEQTRLQQLVTNGISICISLFLGCFVAAGVGLYWAASNLFSILVQLGENLCIPPKRHVDYPKLRRSQAELRKFEDSLKRNALTKEDRQREKADYRRFFQVANKHIVFYAEGGGYYKYFQTIIEWLLAHTNLTIHYVTNDPRDPVLKGEKGERVRGYFIGPTRIIPLFMKMDADMVVMTTPDLNTYHLKRSYVRKDVEYIYVDHGPTSVHMCYRKGAFDHFDTIMCNGPFQVAEHRATEKVYALKAKKLVESGYPLLDLLQVEKGTKNEQELRSEKVVLVANSHQADNIFDSCLDELIQQLETVDNIKIVLRPHPQYVRRAPAKMQAIQQRYAGDRRVAFEVDFSKPSCMSEAAAMITDWSGIAYEFAYRTRRPTLFIDTPMKVINPEWKKIDLVPTDISFRNEVGSSVAMADMPGAAAKIADMLAHPDVYAAKIDRLFKTQFYHPGEAGAEIGKYILEALLERKRK